MEFVVRTAVRGTWGHALSLRRLLLVLLPLPLRLQPASRRRHTLAVLVETLLLVTLEHCDVLLQGSDSLLLLFDMLLLLFDAILEPGDGVLVE